MHLSTKANLYLALATLLWGVTFPLIHTTLYAVNPNVFVTLRFTLAALITLLFVRKQLKWTTRDILRTSIFVGLINTVAYLAQTIGLETVGSSKAAFISGVSVLIVPFIAPLFKLRKKGLILDISCALISLLGLFFITDGNLHFTRGELWELVGALFFSIQIVYLQRITTRISNYSLLLVYQLIFTIPIPFFFSLGHSYYVINKPFIIISLFICAAFSTSLAYFLQNKYQKYTTAAKTALIFAMEPAFATFFGYVINGEIPSPGIWMGGLLILLSLIVPTLYHFIKGMLKKAH